MKTIFFEITKDHQIKGEGLLLKALRGMRPGRYRNDIFSTNKRTVNQNSYLHVVFTLAQKGLYELGYEKITSMEAAKRFYKEMFLTIEVTNEKNGHVYKYIRGTSELNKEEMGVFIDAVREHQLEWAGVNIPTPEEYKVNYQRFDLVTIAH